MLLGLGFGVGSHQWRPEPRFRPRHRDSLGQTSIWTPPAGDTVSHSLYHLNQFRAKSAAKWKVQQCCSKSFIEWINTNEIIMNYLRLCFYYCVLWSWKCTFVSLSVAHYSHMSDVQTLAMLCSVFRAQSLPSDTYSLFGGHHSSRSVMFPPHSRYVSPIRSDQVTLKIINKRRHDVLLSGPLCYKVVQNKNKTPPSDWDLRPLSEQQCHRHSLMWGQGLIRARLCWCLSFSPVVRLVPSLQAPTPATRTQSPPISITQVSYRAEFLTW